MLEEGNEINATVICCMLAEKNEGLVKDIFVFEKFLFELMALHILDLLQCLNGKWLGMLVLFPNKIVSKNR